MYKIVIIMFLATANPQWDGIDVTHFKGKVLEFQTRQLCLDYVWKHLTVLKEFGQTVYDAPVKRIDCFEK